jgi:phage terminase Nu1 subunit (DNA packaging protein)
MRVLKDLEGVVCTTAQLAELLHVSTVHVGLLAKQNVLKRESAGRWLLLENVRNFVEHQRESKKHDASTALRDVRRAQLRRLQLANEERSREVIKMTEALGMLDLVVGLVRGELDSLPSRYTRDLAERKRLETEIDALLNRISAALGKASAGLKHGDNIDIVSQRMYAAGFAR